MLPWRDLLVLQWIVPGWPYRSRGDQSWLLRVTILQKQPNQQIVQKLKTFTINNNTRFMKSNIIHNYMHTDFCLNFVRRVDQKMQAQTNVTKEQLSHHIKEHFKKLSVCERTIYNYFSLKTCEIPVIFHFKDWPSYRKLLEKASHVLYSIYVYVREIRSIFIGWDQNSFLVGWMKKKLFTYCII